MPPAPPPRALQAKLSELVLNFALPHRSLVAKKEVKRVTVPSRDGALGIAKNSPPILAELGPGIVRVDFNDNSSEEFFVPGGFAFKHANNVMDVSAPDGVKLDTIDVEAMRAANAAAQKALGAAAAGSKEQALAKTEVELYKVRARLRVRGGGGWWWWAAAVFLPPRAPTHHSPPCPRFPPLPPRPCPLPPAGAVRQPQGVAVSVAKSQI